MFTYGDVNARMLMSRLFFSIVGLAILFKIYHGLQVLFVHAGPPSLRPVQQQKLSECSRIYIDLGTNTGVQIHKLYNPEFFPRALIRERFNQFFGCVLHI